jgi:hypothetical protein
MDALLGALRTRSQLHVYGLNLVHVHLASAVGKHVIRREYLFVSLLCLHSLAESWRGGGRPTFHATTI